VRLARVPRVELQALPRLGCAHAQNRRGASPTQAQSRHDGQDVAHVAHVVAAAARAGGVLEWNAGDRVASASSTDSIGESPLKFHPLSERDMDKAARIAESGAVYAIRDDERKAVKIGWSTDPIRRLAQLQTAVPHPLRLTAFIAGSKNVERSLHELFSDRHVRGEWYADHDGEVMAVMSGLSEQGF
jgi:hypothetical protein